MSNVAKKVQIVGGVAASAALVYGGLYVLAGRGEGFLREALKSYSSDAVLSVGSVEPLPLQGKTRLHDVRVSFPNDNDPWRELHADSLDVGIGWSAPTAPRVHAQTVTLTPRNGNRSVQAAEVSAVLGNNELSSLQADDLQLRSGDETVAVLSRLRLNDFRPAHKSLARFEGERLSIPAKQGLTLQVEHVEGENFASDDKPTGSALAPGHGTVRASVLQAQDGSGNVLKLRALQLQHTAETGLVLRADDFSYAGPLFTARNGLFNLTLKPDGLNLHTENGAFTPLMPLATSVLSRAGLPAETGVQLDWVFTANNLQQNFHQDLTLVLQGLSKIQISSDADKQTTTVGAHSSPEVLLRATTLVLSDLGGWHTLRRVILQDAGITPEMQSATELQLFRNYLPDEARVQAFQQAFDRFNREGGTITVRSTPEKPQSAQALAFMFLVNPKEVNRVMNINIEYTK